MYYTKNGCTGVLKQTYIEVATKSKRPGYRWKQCLALLNSDGCWLLQDHWRSNGSKRAHNDLIEWGWSSSPF